MPTNPPILEVNYKDDVADPDFENLERLVSQLTPTNSPSLLTKSGETRFANRSLIARLTTGGWRLMTLPCLVRRISWPRL